MAEKYENLETKMRRLRKAGQERLDQWLQDNIVNPAYSVNETLGDVAAGVASVPSTILAAPLPEGKQKEYIDRAQGKMSDLKSAGQERLNRELQDRLVDPVSNKSETLGALASGGAAAISEAYDTIVPGSVEEMLQSAAPVGKLGKVGKAVKSEGKFVGRARIPDIKIPDVEVQRAFNLEREALREANDAAGIERLNKMGFDAYKKDYITKKTAEHELAQKVRLMQSERAKGNIVDTKPANTAAEIDYLGTPEEYYSKLSESAVLGPLTRGKDPKVTVRSTSKKP